MRAFLGSLRFLFAAALLGIAWDAGAGVTITLEWGACQGDGRPCTGLGTSSITVEYTSPQSLRLDVYLSHNLTQGLSAHTFSLNFDTALDNEQNLGPMASVEWSGTDVDPRLSEAMYKPFTAGVTTHDSSNSQAGRINSYESSSITGVLPANGVAYSVGTVTATAPARYRVGQAFFTTNGAATDGADIFSGLFNGLTDGFFDVNGAFVAPGTITFGTASVNVPEPGTVSLLGLGLVCLVLAGRRGRRF